jgi:TPP-dependent pyruvate/acetoin dehydrogenase alpha subunit
MNHNFTPEKLIAFESQVQTLWRAGELPSLIHLSGGNEEQLIAIFDEAEDGDWFLFSHRNHYHSVLAGIPEAQVIQEIKEDRSMFRFSRKHRVFSSAILAGNCGIAVGIAMALRESGSKNRVWCFLGDGAEENGHFYEAVLYTYGHNLPVEFIIEDNSMQVDTPKLLRRGIEHGILDSIPCVRRYRYTPRWPHAGDGIKEHIDFKRTYPL